MVLFIQKGSVKTQYKPGDIKYVNTTGQTDDKGTPVYNSDDMTVIGNANPDFTEVLKILFSYKGFDSFCIYGISLMVMIFLICLPSVLSVHTNRTKICLRMQPIVSLCWIPVLERSYGPQPYS